MNTSWSAKRLDEIAQVIPSGVDKKSHPDEIQVRLCNYLDVYNNDVIHSRMPLSSATATDAEIRRCLLQKGDVVITKDSETPDDIGKPAVVLEDLDGVVCGYHLAILRPDQDSLNGPYLAQVFRLPSFRKRLGQVANGAIRFGLTSSALNSIEVRFPPLHEQEAIAKVLYSWDRGIRLLSDLIAVKQLSRDGLVQRLLNGSLRFRVYSKSAHPSILLSQILEKVSDSVIPVDNQMYREIGVRSHGKGIFHKEPVTGESLGNKRVFRVVPGCLTLNIVFAWERAVAITSEREFDMIASHRFPMFRPDPSSLLAEYALLYLLSKKGSEALELASPGGAGRNRTLSQTAFLKNRIPLPSIPEQRTVVTFVQALDREIELLRKQLEALKEQKKGLMQKLLTGQVTVKP